jgi:hypothetical protein
MSDSSTAAAVAAAATTTMVAQPSGEEQVSAVQQQAASSSSSADINPNNSNNSNRGQQLQRSMVELEQQLLLQQQLQIQQPPRIIIAEVELDDEPQDPASALAAIDSLRAESAALKAENAALKATNIRLNENRSVMAMLRDHGGIPPLQTNTARTSSSSSSSSGHIAAASDNATTCTILEMSVQNILETFVKNVQVNFFKSEDNTDSGHLIKSSIAIQLDDKRMLSNLNPATAPTFYMISLLGDVLHCLHLFSSTDVAQERSLFALRCNLVVVRDEKSQRILLVVQVLNPGANGRRVLENDNLVIASTAADRAFDNAMVMKHQMGNDHGLVVLTTYDHMRMASLVDCSRDIMPAAAVLVEHGRPIGT